MNPLYLLGVHYLNEMTNPSRDSELWLAYLCLRQMIPTTDYWSYDGYHVGALVDYTRNLLWEDDVLTSIDRSVKYKSLPYLYDSTTEEIITIWKKGNV